MMTERFRCKQEIIVKDIVLRQGDIVDGYFSNNHLIIFLSNGWRDVDRNMFELLGDYQLNKIENDIQAVILLRLEKIKINQEIVQAQMTSTSLGYATCNPIGKGLKKLQYLDLIYQAARDIKEFDGSIEDWIEIIMKELDKL